MRLITDDFLLQTKTARTLYRTVRRAAADPRLSLPSAAEGHRRAIAGSRTCSRSGSRAITTSGARCGPTASPSATAPAMPRRTTSSWRGPRPCRSCLRNPLYHWTHLELKRYFGIDELLDEQSAAAIWKRGQRAARSRDELTRARHSRASSTSSAVCTTDDPAEPLDHHAAIARVGSARRRSIRPSVRTARWRSHDPAVFNPWVDRLAATARRARSRTFADFARRAAASGTRPFTTRAAACPITACPIATPPSAPTRRRRRSSIARAPAGGDAATSTSSSRRT